MNIFDCSERFETAAISTFFPTRAVFGECWLPMHIGEGWPMIRLRNSPDMTWVLRQELTQITHQLKQLDDGWLGDGSEAIPAEVIERVDAIAASLQSISALPNPEVTPNPNGTISLEWESDAGDAYLEVGRTRMSGYIRSAGGIPEFFKDVPSVSESLFQEIQQRLYPPTRTYSITAYEPEERTSALGAYQHAVPEELVAA